MLNIKSDWQAEKFKLENLFVRRYLKFACGAAMLGFEWMHGHIMLRLKGLSVENKITRPNGLETNTEDNVRTCLRSLS